MDLLSQLTLGTRVGWDVLPRVAAATEDELRGLAASPAPQVRALVVARDDLPADLVAVLVSDPDPMVGKRISTHPGLTPAQLRALALSHGTRALAKIAANPACPPDLLHDIAAQSKSALRQVAGNPAASAAALMLTLQDPAARRRAARHPSLPPDEIVKLLFDDPDEHVREAAAANRALPVAAMERLIAFQGMA